MERTEATTLQTGASSPDPMTGIWRTIRGYVLWSYERGTIQYDVMVTLILLFVFLSPRYIDYNDKPIDRTVHPTGVVVVPDANGFIFEVEGTAVKGTDDAAIRNELLRIVEPISGEVTITKYEIVRDGKGAVLSYKVWAQRS